VNALGASLRGDLNCNVSESNRKLVGLTKSCGGMPIPCGDRITATRVALTT